MHYRQISEPKNPPATAGGSDKNGAHRTMTNKRHSEDRPKPFINVTPLIDVLLVLLIIFMVVSPLKQARFSAKVPAERPENERLLPPPDSMLLVTIALDHTLKLNSLGDMGTVEETAKLSAKLTEVFALRTQNRAFSYEMLARTDLPDALRVQKTVFIKAPRAMNYGDVVKVIDGIKVAGATPIGLQLDDLN
jgi:biopolymer transport protein ExbD